jgi:transcriptional regulator with XRE-family HTH domain
MVTIGEKIRKMRELRNYTQEYMAERLQIKQATYSNLETGVAEIKFIQVEKVATVLEISLLELINFDEKKVFKASNNKEENQKSIRENSTNTEKQLYEQILVMQKERIVFLENLVKTHLTIESLQFSN